MCVFVFCVFVFYVFYVFYVFFVYLYIIIIIIYYYSVYNLFLLTKYKYIIIIKNLVLKKNKNNLIILNQVYS